VAAEPPPQAPKNRRSRFLDAAPVVAVVVILVSINFLVVALVPKTA
jgi:hypothetical protein